MTRFAVLLLVATMSIAAASDNNDLDSIDEVGAGAESGTGAGADTGAGAVKASACLTLNTPTEAANKASIAASVAAEAAKVKAIAYAQTSYDNAVIAADAIKTKTDAAALVSKNMANQGATIKFTAMEMAAKAKAAKLLMKENARILRERKASELEIVETTKHTFEVIAEKHRHKMQKIMDDEMAKERSDAEIAHFTKASKVAETLTVTKAEFGEANSAHKAEMETAFTTYAAKKTKVETTTAALEATLVAKATAANTAMKKEVNDRYARHIAAAAAAFSAANQTAAAKQQDMIARADAESKEAEMKAWVETMSSEVTAATWCDPNGFDITAAGTTKAAGASSEKTAAANKVAVALQEEEDTSEYDAPSSTDDLGE